MIYSAFGRIKMQQKNCDDIYHLKLEVILERIRYLRKESNFRRHYSCLSYYKSVKNVLSLVNRHKNRLSLSKIR